MNADIFAVLLKVSAILSVAAIVALLLRDSSAARRHFVWSAAMSSVVVLVLLQLIVPPIVVRVAEHSPLAAIAHATSEELNAPAAIASRASTPADMIVSRDNVNASSSVSALAAIASPANTTPTRAANSNTARVMASTSRIIGEPLPPASKFETNSSSLSEVPEHTLNNANQTTPWLNLRASLKQVVREQLRAVLLSLWAFGSIVLLFRLVLAHWQLRRIARSAAVANQAIQASLDQLAERLDVDGSVRLLISERVTTPCTAGWRHPIILLPASFTEWTDARHQAVLTHELAHIARADSLTQTVASIACALFWFHPGFWLAARMLRGESERAADDCVINSGMAPLEYADHLLAIAQSSSTRPGVPTVALAMARSSQLELRLRAMLNQRQSRRAVTRNAQRVLGVAALTAVIPFAALQARVQQPRPKVPPKVPVSVIAPVAPPAVVAPAMRPLVKPVPVVEIPNALVIMQPWPSMAIPGVVPRSDSVIIQLLPNTAIPVVVPPNAPATIRPLPMRRGFGEPLPAKIDVPPLSPTNAVAPPMPTPPRTTPPIRSATTDTTYDKTIDAVSGDSLVISIPAGGNVTVHGWDSNSARLKANIGGKYWRETRVVFVPRKNGIYFLAVPEINGVRVAGDAAQGDGKYIMLRPADAPLYVPTTIDNEFELWIPRKMHVKYSSPIGSFTTNGVEGNLDGATKFGALDISNASGKANLSTENGDVHVSASTLTGSVHTDCGELNVSNTGNKLAATTKFDPTPSKDPKYAGTIYIIDGMVSTEYCRLKPRTSTERGVDEGVPYGPLAIDAAPYGGRLNTRSGDITVGSSGGVLFAGTSNANIDIRRMSGDITAMGSHGNIDIQTINTNSAIHNIWVRGSTGTVTIELPDSIDAAVDIEVSYTEEFLAKFNRPARIRDDRSLPQTESTTWVRVNSDPLRKFVRSQGTLGKGTGRIYIRVVDGDVVLKRSRA